MTNQTLQNELDRLQKQIQTGTVVLVLGPNTRERALNLQKQQCPSQNEIHTALLQHLPERLKNTKPSRADIVSFLNADPEGQQQLHQLLTNLLRVTEPGNDHIYLTTLVWKRIYTFDLSDSLELAYHRNAESSQTPAPHCLQDPLTTDIQYARNVGVVKIFGDITRQEISNFYSDPNYWERNSNSPWFVQFARDAQQHTMLFLGCNGDHQYFADLLRQIPNDVRFDNIRIFCPNFPELNAIPLENRGLKIYNIDFISFVSALRRAMPQGRRLNEILSETSSFSLLPNNKLAARILNDFDVIDLTFFERINSENAEYEGQIRRFYRGQDPSWHDIISGIHADLTPYKNFRGRIQNEFESNFPHGSLFVLSSPAGMGKTVGLMSTAKWLRTQISEPILFFRPEGDLKGFLLSIEANDFERGVYVFVDDITLYSHDFDNVPNTTLAKICFVTTSRETRWNRYANAITSRFQLLREETIRKLNLNDAQEIQNKISKYGTRIYFNERTPEDQAREILRKSGRDLLVLISELGQGQKFQQIVRSETRDLTRDEFRVYLLVCIPDRNQVPIPGDLLYISAKTILEGDDPNRVVSSLGRLLHRRSGSKAIRSRHSVIAGQILESHELVPFNEKREAVEALLKAFTAYRIPILVHHSNTGHARVFKSVINNRFLSTMFGVEEAINIYRKFEKDFETDAFFWQQFGLTYLRARRFNLAIETLQHAATLHHHIQIRHSLAVAKLNVCWEEGITGLGESDFSEMRESAIDELWSLHRENAGREDLAITALSDWDLRVSKRHDSGEEYRRRVQEYLSELAFYVRSHPSMRQAREVYDKIYKKATSVDSEIELTGSELLDRDIAVEN